MTTWQNLHVLYDFVYKQVVAAGVAVPLSVDEEYWIDEKEICNKEKAVSMKVVGDIVQDNDGNIGGQLYLYDTGTRAQINAVKDKKAKEILVATVGGGVLLKKEKVF
eukprot:3478892-Ditylum_brightwellii.AAC.1